MKYFVLPFVFLLMSSCATHRGNHDGLKNYRPSLLGPQMDLNSLRSHHIESMQ
jgi:hypothetical protein